MLSTASRILSWSFLTFIIVSCASLSSDENHLENEIQSISKNTDPTDLNQLEASYNSKKIEGSLKAKASINLESCIIGEQKSHALLLFPSSISPEIQKLQCLHPIIQAFLGKGYAVQYIALSKEDDDFGGVKSRALLEKASIQLNKDKDAISILWGYGATTAAISFASKKMNNLKFIILGNGLYDAELSLKTFPNSDFASYMNNTDPKKKDKAIEDRSISWDHSGISKEIKMYHQEDESSFPVSQAETFKDSLVAAQFSVKFQKIPMSQDWNSQKHRQIIELLLPRAP